MSTTGGAHQHQHGGERGRAAANLKREDNAAAGLAACDITPELERRQSRERDYDRELAAMRRLGASFGGSPEHIFDTLALEALAMTGAGSAGLTLSEVLPGGGHTVRWSSLAGVMKGHDAPQVAWHESIGGACIQAGRPLLYKDPAIAFPRLADLRPLMREALVVPVPGPHGGIQGGSAGSGSAAFGHGGRDTSQVHGPIGAVWVALHEGQVRTGPSGENGGARVPFDREDVRLLTALAVFAGAGVVAAKLQEESNIARREAEQAAEDLRRSNRDLDEFAQIVAHDLKEPLRGVRAYAEMVRDDAGAVLDPASLARLESVGRLSERMSGMIGGLLEYARAGHGELKVERLELGTLVHDALDAVRWLVESERVQVTVASGLPAVRGDRSLLLQVLTNLLSNGIKYNRSPLKTLEVEDSEQHGEVTLRIRDNGLGIPAEERDSVFRMFRRGRAAAAVAPGTGVGLAIVRRIVERHGGRVWVEPRPDGQSGSVFCLTLPQA
ncbi:MAG TPA: HAMP domain-containing sensor histidine kinase [Phycisphaerales bacterium]|nr:HAMP domain-containing sensor histidine kinase [Phycisphaerales bacterium]